MDGCGESVQRRLARSGRGRAGGARQGKAATGPHLGSWQAGPVQPLAQRLEGCAALYAHPAQAGSRGQRNSNAKLSSRPCKLDEFAWTPSPLPRFR